jgi:hypothetical protein
MAPVIRCDSTYPCETDEHVQPYINPDFPDQADGVSGCYQKTAQSQEVDFRAGSYSGYNWWREELETMARGSFAFADMIHFSDCEGTIGPVTSAKLARDFAKFQPQANARAEDGTMFTAKYNLWRKAFETASDNGFVRFR